MERVVPISRYEREISTLERLKAEAQTHSVPGLFDLGGEAQSTPRVLVVDDVALVRQACCEILSGFGLWTMAASDGKSALEKYHKARPDVVLLDIGMPGLDGIATLQALQQLDPDVRVVMLTGLGEQAQVQAALRAGARDYVLKPFSIERVLQAIRRALA